jgi:hypothetical protein
MKGEHKKLKPIPKLKKELWKHFSLFIRRRDGGVCFICGRRCEGQGYQTSHFIAKSICGIELYFSEKNNHGCCYNCNINLGGNLYEYGQKLGEETCKELYAIKLKTKGAIWSREKYEEKIAYYKELLTQS